MTRARRVAAGAIALAVALSLALLPAAAASAVPLPSFTLAGTITDGNGLAVVGATYRLTSGSHSFSATSTAGGAYSIANVPAGDYATQLFTAAPGYDLVNSYYTVPVGGSTTADLVLPLISTVTGTVTDPTNNPVAGVLVSVSYLDEPFGSTGVSNGGAGTDATGTFDFNLAQGRNIVSYAPPAGSDLEYQWYSNVHTAASAHVFTAAPDAAGSPFDASVQLVTNTDQATGTVTLAGVPQPNAFAYVSDAAGDEFAEVQSGVGGAYSTAGLPDGSYTIQAHYSVGVNSYVSQAQPFTVAGGDVTVADLVLVTDPGTFSTGVSDTYTAAENTVLSVPAARGVTSNDTRTPAGQLFAVVDTFPTHGQLFLQYDGALTYAPDDGFVGTDTFTYQPSPFFPTFGPGGTATTVTIRVNPQLAATGVPVSPALIGIAILAILTGVGIRLRCRAAR